MTTTSRSKQGFTMIPDAILKMAEKSGVHTFVYCGVTSYLVRKAFYGEAETLTLAIASKTLRLDRRTIKRVAKNLHDSWASLTQPLGQIYLNLHDISDPEAWQQMPKLLASLTQQEKVKVQSLIRKKGKNGRFAPSAVGKSSLQIDRSDLPIQPSSTLVITNRDRSPVPKGPRSDGLDRTGRTEGIGPREGEPIGQDDDLDAEWIEAQLTKQASHEVPEKHPPDLARLEGLHLGKVKGWFVFREEGEEPEEWLEGECQEEDVIKLKKARPEVVIIPTEFDRWLDSAGRVIMPHPVEEERQRQKNFRDPVSKTIGQTK